MAAREEGREGTFCERCFGPLAVGETVCPDCGAPTDEGAAGSDSPAHRELAQANLLRLRGDLDGSEKALLAVLRRMPNDPLAHEMLGEVCAERGELDRAVEWYELALDLAPNSTEARRRLQEARERLEARDTADTAETLGLPSARPALTWAPLAGVGALVALAAIVALWPRSAAPRPLRATVVAPTTPTLSSAAPPASLPASTPATVVPPSASGTEEERKLLEGLRAQSGTARVQSASLDPRTQTLAVTFEIGEADDPKLAAIAIGRAALGLAPTAMTASLRAVRADRLALVADLPRATMANAEPLTNLWPAETPVATPPPASAPTGTSGTAPTGSSPSPGSATTGGEGKPASGSMPSGEPGTTGGVGASGDASASPNGGAHTSS